MARAGAAVLCWVNEDELPEGLTQEAYSALFPHSKVDVVRMFPIFGPTAQAAPAGAGTWAHLKLMMEESAWDGTLQLSDALANIDDFAAAHPSPPEGMAGWTNLRGQRMVLCSLLGECLPVIDALLQLPGDDDSDAHLNGLAGRITGALNALAEERVVGGES